MSKKDRLKNFGEKASMVLRVARVTFTNVLFLLFLVMILGSIFISDKVKVPEGGALVMPLSGEIVDQRNLANPMDYINPLSPTGGGQVKQMLLPYLVAAIEASAKDERIKVLVLDLREAAEGGLAAFKEIGQALARFKESGKKIIAYGDSLDQKQYYLASFADGIYLHPSGDVSLKGFGIFQSYFGEALEKAKVNVHVFKAGQYKSAVEPYTLTGMSPEVKEVNLALLSDLWTNFRDEIASNRGVSSETIDTLVNDPEIFLAKSRGDISQMVLDTGLIDGFLSRSEFRDLLKEIVGENKDKDDFSQISYADYIKAPDIPKSKEKKKPIAVIVASGAIVPGKTNTGEIGGDSLAHLIRKASENEDIKAVVLRVNSPGGSAFASEVIRQEILNLKKAGKYVAVSMGDFAASGGYWISAPADLVMATEYTITGSIGVFGLVSNLDDTLKSLGIHNDGVGSSKMAAGVNPLRPLAPEFENLLNHQINHTYTRFLEVVSQGREMDPMEIDKIARGRIWSGTAAKEIGLVDEIGTLNDTIAKVAAHLDVSPDAFALFDRKPSPQEAILRLLSEGVSSFVPMTHTQGLAAEVSAVYRDIYNDMAALSSLRDPRGIYALSPVTAID